MPNVEPKQEGGRPAIDEREFGITIGGVLGTVAIVRLGFAARDGWPPPVDLASWCLFAVSATLLGLALIRPSWLVVPNRLWFKFGLLLARVVNPVVMLLLYATCIVPIGMAMRLFGYDPLKLKPDPKAATYWLEHEQSPLEEPMRHQF